MDIVFKHAAFLLSIVCTLLSLAICLTKWSLLPSLVTCAIALQLIYNVSMYSILRGYWILCSHAIADLGDWIKSSQWWVQSGSISTSEPLIKNEERTVQVLRQFLIFYLILLLTLKYGTSDLDRDRTALSLLTA